MGYSARRGFSNGSQNAGGSRRQAEMQQRFMKMQQEVDAAEEEIKAQEFTATSGGGAVQAKVNGKKELLDLTIQPDAANPEDVEILQDMVISAVNEALRQAGEAMDKRMEELGGGLNLGGLNLGGLGL